MKHVMDHAKAIVAFNHTLKEKLSIVFPSITCKISIIAQSCPLISTTSSCTEDYEGRVNHSHNAIEETTPSSKKWRENLGYSPEDFLVLLPASIRAVKAPHFILRHFQKYQEEENQAARLLIVGPVLEREYVQQHAELECLIPVMKRWWITVAAAVVVYIVYMSSVMMAERERQQVHVLQQRPMPDHVQQETVPFDIIHHCQEMIFWPSWANPMS
jgi:hypothetical protein